MFGDRQAGRPGGTATAPRSADAERHSTHANADPRVMLDNYEEASREAMDDDEKDADEVPEGMEVEPDETALPLPDLPDREGQVKAFAVGASIALLLIGLAFRKLVGRKRRINRRRKRNVAAQKAREEAEAKCASITLLSASCVSLMLSSSVAHFRSDASSWSHPQPTFELHCVTFWRMHTLPEIAAFSIA
jgi:hypothetical protein